MSMRFATAIVSLSIVTSGCGLVRNLAATAPLAPSIPFKVIAPIKGAENHLSGPAQTLVVKSQTELNAFLATLPVTGTDGRGNPIPPMLPSLNFEQEQGVIVLFGAQSHEGYKGEISAIEEKADRFVVHSVRRLPKDDGIYAMQIVYPYHYVAMKRSEKPVEFAPTVDLPRPGPWWSIF